MVVVSVPEVGEMVFVPAAAAPAASGAANEVEEVSTTAVAARAATAVITALILSFMVVSYLSDVLVEVKWRWIS
jgi:hypothetical protein